MNHKLTQAQSSLCFFVASAELFIAVKDANVCVQCMYIFFETKGSKVLFVISRMNKLTAEELHSEGKRRLAANRQMMATIIEAARKNVAMRYYAERGILPTHLLPKLKDPSKSDNDLSLEEEDDEGEGGPSKPEETSAKRPTAFVKSSCLFFTSLRTRPGSPHKRIYFIFC